MYRYINEMTFERFKYYKMANQIYIYINPTDSLNLSYGSQFKGKVQPICTINAWFIFDSLQLKTTNT